MKALQESNGELEGLLAQLRIPKTDVFTLERPVNLEFKDLIHEMAIILLPQLLIKLDLKLNVSNLTIEEYFTAKMLSLSRNRKNSEMYGPSNPLGNGKEILSVPH